MLKRIFTLTLLVVVALASVQAQEEVSAAKLYNDGLEKAKSGEFEMAVDLMSQAIEKADPEDATDKKVIRLARGNGSRAAYGLGSKHLKAKEYDAAKAAFEQGIEFNPNYYGNYRGVATALEEKGMVTEAIGFYVKAGNIAVENPKTAERGESYLDKAENLIAIAWGKKEWDNVVDYTNALLAAEYETADTYYYAAAAYNGKGNAEKAIEMADKAISMTEGDPSKYYFEKAEALEASGQKAAAVEAYKQVKAAKYAERAQYKVNELGGN